MDNRQSIAKNEMENEHLDGDKATESNLKNV